MTKIIFLATFFMASLALLIFGQSATSQREQKIVVGTNEVQLDVVAKDKKGRIIRDLKPGDIEIYEDGVKQQVDTFRLMTRNSPAANVEETKPGNKAADASVKSEPAKVSRDVETSISAVAIVFDRLSPDARKRAHDAAMSYVGENPIQESYIGVYAINLGINTLQGYTVQTPLIKKAIDRAGVMASASFDAPGGIYTDSAVQKLNQANETASSAAAAASSAGAAGNGAGAAAAGAASGAASVDAKFAEMELNIKETFEVLQRDEQGYATTNGLIAIINSMQKLPGRKAIMYFSEGVAVPPNVKLHFLSVINNANKANVSIYSIDSAGLRAISPNQATRDEINNRQRNRMNTLDTQMRNNGPLTAGLERNEDLMGQNPQEGLMKLSAETGGQFIGDTNNIAPRLKQVDEDLNTYYMLTYSPTNQNYDGKFRNISVKLNRSGIDAQTRKGYYAVSAGSTTPVLFYETAALAALANNRADNTIPMKSRSFNFPENIHLGRTAFEVEMPTQSFTFIEDKAKKSYSTDFSVVVLVKDENKQVVRKLSTHYLLNGYLDQMAKMKSGLVLFYREENLPPGKYDVEAAAYDLPSNKVSIQKTTVEVPDLDANNLRLSSIVLVKRGEPLPKDQKPDSPFLFGEVMLYPNLGEPISKAAKQLSFFFTIYPAKGSTFTPQLTVELSQNGKALAAAPLKLPAPSESGKIPYFGNLPLEALPPGDYDLKATVRSDKGSVSRSTKFTVTP